MVLSKRERYIAIGSAAAIALLVLDYAVLSPYFEKRSDVATQLADARQQRADADLLFARQRKLQKVWDDMVKGGLKVDPSQAESQAQHAVLGWATSADIAVSSLKPERSTQNDKFQVLNFSVSGNGNTPALARLLWAIESTRIPVRVNDLQISPRHEGADDLAAKLTVSALCLPPEADASAKISSAARQGQP